MLCTPSYPQFAAARDTRPASTATGSAMSHAMRRARPSSRAWQVVSTLALLTLLVVAPQPARAEAPATYMQRVANELVTASRTGSQQAFAAVIRRHADVPYIGISSLGSYARALAAIDRPTYFSGMVNFISRYAAKEAPKYPVATVVAMAQTEEDKNGVYVDSRITLRSGETYDVRWWLVRNGASFKVRDAQVAGFWMSPFLKTLFENYIGENGGNPKALVIALNR